MTDLLKLATRCEQATGPDRELDEAIRVALGLGKVLLGVGDGLCATDEDYEAAEFTASLDAAMTLVPEGWRFAGSETLRGDFYAHLITRELVTNGLRAHTESTANTFALALCAAALRARAESAK